MPQVIDSSGKVVREVAVPEVFAADVSSKANAIFRAVFRELANPRAGTHSTLKRDEVAGGGRKPWRQKGTGRARQGSIRSPQWRHGGVVFGPQPRSYVSSLNKKERRAAMIAALSDRFQSGAVTLLATDGLALTKTKELATLLFGSPKAAKSGPRTLLVFAEGELASVGTQLVRAGYNLERLAVTHTGALDVKDVVGYERLVLTTAASDVLAAERSNGLMDAREIVIAPVITEKSMAGTAAQQYTFEVDARASKTQIKAAIQEIFKVSVIKINTTNVGGKFKNFVRRGTRTHGKMADWKKAIVTLAPGQKIELGGVNYFEQ